MTIRCNSFVGMLGTGKQIINLGAGCQHKSTAIHEIGHALGKKKHNDNLI